MNIRPIPDSLPGEHLLSVVPKPAPTVDPPWHRRLNLVTGRSLSAPALQAEQRGRAGHLALLGGSLSPGVVAGLPVTIELGVGTAPDYLHIGVGSGITAQGEEVVVSQALRVEFAALRQQAQTQTTVQILLLQPITVLTQAADRDDCNDDDSDLAFSDRQLIDGVALRLYDWQANVPLTGNDPASVSRWRNQLAYTLFNQELQQNERGERLPWETIGLPIALLGLDLTLTKVMFADSYAVVRQGGKPLPRSPLVPNSGHEFIWQARVQQFTEQFAETPFQSVEQAAMSEYFRYLPPVGLLPANAVDWATRQSFFFPANYAIRARVLPLEELDKLMEASASLLPLMLDRPEQVEVIVPIPSAFYEPDVLKQETLNPIFAQTRQRLWQYRAEWLGRRNWNRDRITLVTRILTGKGITFDTDQSNLPPGQLEDVEPGSPPPLTRFDPPLRPEPDFGTVVNDTTLQATVLEQLRIDLRNKTPLDQDAAVVTAWTATIPEPLRQKVSVSGLLLLTVRGALQATERDALIALSPTHRTAIEDLFQRSQNNAGPTDIDSVEVPGWAATIPENLRTKLSLSGSQVLTVKGVMQATERDALLALSPTHRPAIENLFQQSQDNNDLEQLNPQSANFKGLTAFISYLESKVTKADDAIEFGFLQVRTDMYRVRQFVLGTEEATRLATSPTLAEIAKRDSAVATQKDLQKFFEQSRGKTVSTAPQRTFLGAEAIAAGGGEEVQIRAAQITRSNQTLLATQSALLPTANLRLAESISISEAAVPLSLSPLATARALDLSNAVLAKPASTTISSSAAFQSKITSADAISVIAQSPIIGRAQQSVSVGDRLTQPAALQTRDYTVANRQTALESIAKVGIFKDVLIPGKNVSFGQVRPGQLPPDENDLPANADEFNFISSGVKALDNTVAALRLAEGRVQTYRDAIILCQTAATQLQTMVEQMSQRLQVIETELAEVRHDLSVTRALENEEITRITTLNDRRQAVLQQQVPFLAFHRPRFAHLWVNSPVVYVNPAPTVEPVPACLNAHPGVPDDLRAMVDLLRHAPVGWFVALPRVVDQLNTLDLLYRAFDVAQQRTTLPVLTLISEDRGFGQGIRRTMQSHHQVLVQKRQALVSAPSQLRPPTWQAGRDQANTILTLGDLMDGNHGRSTVSRQATRLLDQMAQVAACLYDRFNDVPTPIRLGWAQQLSEFDSPVDLRSLASLPNWSELPFLDRRDLQTLADWLYQQVQTTEPAAIAFVNDLIQISILLASHAPVRQIINGTVIRPIPARPGNRLDLTVDHTRVTVGMTVLLHSPTQEVIAQAVVADLSQGQATATITQLLRSDVQQIAVNTRARFVQRLF